MSYVKQSAWMMAMSLVLSLVLTGCGKEEPPAAGNAGAALQQATNAAQGAAQAVADAYPLDTCVVSGHKFGSGGMEAVTVTHEGRSVKLCCDGCIEAFKKEPAKYLAILDKAIAGQKPAAAH